MLCLKLVKSVEAEARTHPTNDGLNHGTRVILYLICPWARTLWTVVGDSYFASVMTACQLCQVGLRFIGVVKTATTGFSMAALQSAQFNNRGGHKALHHHGDGTTDDPSLLAVAWVDHKRHYFVLTTSNQQAAPHIHCRCLCQVDKTPNAAPQHVDLTIPQTNVSVLHYENCSMIDHHNCI